LTAARDPSVRTARSPSSSRGADMVTPTDRPDERTPAPEEDIQETTETVEETLEPAPRDPDDDPDDDDD
jgi:hypothetical protein